ncbi:MAG: T9SS type A sorting domain-containing protein, partial [Flavobacteriales bacterium]
GDFDVYLSESTNSGATWTTPVRVNDDNSSTPRMQDMLWGSFDNDGDLLITWRDRRGGTNVSYNNPSEFYYAYRKHTQNTFSQNISLSKQLVPFNAVLEKSGNDFMSSVLLNDTINAVWGETHDGSLDIWFIRLVAASGVITDISSINKEAFNFTVFPNPNQGIFSLKLEDAKESNLKILDQQGKIIQAQKFNNNIISADITKEAADIYFIVLECEGKQSVHKIIKQ